MCDDGWTGGPGTYELPEDQDTAGGIYTLDDLSPNSDPYIAQQRDTRSRALSTVRMRGKEGFTSFQNYSDHMPTDDQLRSSRRGRSAIEGVAWDGRPRGFRPDDNAQYSAFVPPPAVRPPYGGPTPWMMSDQHQSYSNAIVRQQVMDPNAINLAPCSQKDKMTSLPVKRWAQSAARSPTRLLLLGLLFLSIVICAMLSAVLLRIRPMYIMHHVHTTIARPAE
jgi:hypothetical protein